MKSKTKAIGMGEIMAMGAKELLGRYEQALLARRKNHELIQQLRIEIGIRLTKGGTSI